MLFVLFSYVLTKELTEIMSLNEAKNVLNDLENIEVELQKHVSNLNDFASRFDFLLANDQKLRNTINYLQNMDKLKQIEREIISVPIDFEKNTNFNEKENYFYYEKPSGLFKKISNFMTSQRFILKSPKQSAINRIDFSETKNQSCLVKSFCLVFRNQESKSENKIGTFKLLQNKEKQSFELPSHVYFNEFDIIPIDNWGDDDSIFCIPKIQVFGEKGFQ